MKSAHNFLSTSVRVLGVAAATMAMSATWALNPGQRVENFRLPDETGKQHELYALKDQRPS
jgi:hypothetical protein